MLQIYDLSKVELSAIRSLRSPRVMHRAAPFVEIAVVVSCYDHDVAITISGTRPDFLMPFQPVNGLLN